MIVHFPTAYFESVLPQAPSDAGNVTWTCSSSTPPRSNLFVNQITALLASEAAVASALPTDLDRRSARGDLVYTTSEAAPGLALSGTKQYEAGQILDFVDGTPLTLVPQLVAPSSETRHDTNYLDLSQLGFSAAEATNVMARADAAARTLVDQLNMYRQQRLDVETQLSNAQRALNEAVKAQAAIAVVLSVSPGPDIQAAYDKVTAKIAAIQAQQQALVSQGNALAEQTQAARDAVLAAYQLVR